MRYQDPTQLAHHRAAQSPAAFPGTSTIHASATSDSPMLDVVLPSSSTQPTSHPSRLISASPVHHTVHHAESKDRNVNDETASDTETNDWVDTMEDSYGLYQNSGDEFAPYEPDDEVAQGGNATTRVNRSNRVRHPRRAPTSPANTAPSESSPQSPVAAGARKKRRTKVHKKANTSAQKRSRASARKDAVQVSSKESRSRKKGKSAGGSKGHCNSWT